jgi:NTP pyrophosphatase (non-canonical NTP hydrolase)
MEIKEYQEQSSRTFAQIDNGVLDDMHMILGMQTEVAEIADAFKKSIAYNKPLDLTNVKEEIGDVMWYIANMCNIYGWDLRDIMQTNIDKLKARYPEKFTTENALNRDLDAERKILER